MAIDDKRFDPMWDTCGQLKMPVAIHIADPVAFFTPTDRFNERYEELHNRRNGGRCRTAGALFLSSLLWLQGLTIAALVLGLRPETSYAGIAITVAALIVMPVLAFLKRREARRSKNAALAADAVQSATCAYLALIALTGLAINAAFHIGWFDSVAALVSCSHSGEGGQIGLARSWLRMLLSAPDFRNAPLPKYSGIRRLFEFLPVK